MTTWSDTRYARSGDLQIAWVEAGESETTLVYVPGFVSHVEVWTRQRHIAEHLGRLASFTRLVLFDKRGTGLSDPWEGAPTLDERMDDIRAVMDDADVERAAILGISEGGPLAIVFAATYPERVSSLVLYAAGAKFARSEDYPYGPTREEIEAFLPTIQETWGVATSSSLALAAPSMMDDAEFVEEWGRARRTAASPKMATEILRMNVDIDVRAALPAIDVPTLVMHRATDLFVPVDHGRYLAEHIRGAKYVELPGGDHMPFLGSDEIVDEMEEFLTGHRTAREPERALATVLFTDIVGSTERAAAEGDERWRSLLDEHDRLTRREVEHHGGRAVKSTGDGFLATFDRPGRAVDAARAIVQAVAGAGLEVRAGLHAGEVELRGEDVGGIAVHIGARVGALADPGEVLVSGTVKDLVIGSGHAFDDRGRCELKGVPGTWQLYALA